MGKSFIVQCRGLPWECTDDQLKEFFDNNGIEYVDIPKRGGRSTGEGVVCFDNDGDFRNALKKDKQMLGSRYIDVFPINGSTRRKDDVPTPGYQRIKEFNNQNSRGPPRDNYRERSAPYHNRRREHRDVFGGDRRNHGDDFSGDAIIKLRGLPFAVTIRDVIDFFAPLAIVRDGVLLPDQRRAKVTGEAMVVFEHPESAQLAKNRHMKNIGHRYIEVFEANFNDLMQFADENNLRPPSTRRPPPPRQYPSGGPPPPQQQAPGPYNGPQDYRPPNDNYRDNNGGYPPRDISGFGRPNDGPPRNGPGPDYGPPPHSGGGGGRFDYRGSPQPPFGGNSGGGYYDSPYGPPKTNYDSFPRPDSRNPDYRQGGGNGPDPYPINNDSRYSDFGSGHNRGGYESRDSYQPPPQSNWRGGNSNNGPPSNGPIDSYNGGGNGGGGGRWGNGPPQQQQQQHSGGPPPPSRNDSYGYPPAGDSYARREGGGPMRRPDYGRGDDRYSKPEPYGNNYRNDNREYQGTQHFVLRMRGVPFRATEADVFDFFLPVRPNHIELLKDNSGRPSGDARVIFYNRKDYDDALMKDRQYIGDRYIEMIPDNGRY